MRGRLGFYLRYAWRFVVLRRPEPLIYGIAITDRCNFACEGCRVANTGRTDMTYDALVANLRDAYARGFREVYFTGGEPTLWRDGERTLLDAIEAARGAGFFHIHVYTNGSRGLDWPVDLVWVSMDGLPETFAVRRGDHFEEVERAIRSSRHPRLAVIYTIDRHTESGVEAFLGWVRDARLPVLGVMFYFHTPYYGVDELFLSAEERAPIIERLLACIGEGLPVLNSRAALRALETGHWQRRTPAAAVVDVDGESICCRAPDEACEECGYAACTEIVEARRLRPSAVLAMGRYW
jgi:MoaA/NifB/PqqE/SkfB family radical SAM enzyme